MTATAASLDRTEQPPAPAAPPSRRARLVRGLAPAVVAAGSGVLLYVSFPPRTLWWLALPAFAVFGWILHGRGWKAGAGLGYLFGLGFLLPLLVWTGVEVGPGPWLTLVAAEACFPALVGAGVAVTSRLPAWPLWAAALWIAGEAARARAPFGGFPWGKVAFGQADGVFLPLAALGGTPVLGFAVVLCGFGLCEIVRQAVAVRRRRVLRRPAAVVALLAVAVPLAAAGAARPLVSDAPEDGTATVAVIQGNVPRAGLGFNAQRRAVLDYHLRETLRLAAEVKAGRVARPDLVLWPENSSDIDPFTNPDARTEIDEAVKAIGAPLSVGAVVQKPDGRLYNEQVLWDPRKGPTSTYDKRQIQPFGEYIPLRNVIGAFGEGYVSMVPQDFSRGTEPGVFTMAGARVGLVTCYEAAFDWTVRSTVQAGAQLISVPSNNATFDRSEMTYQQLAMSRIRAVEHSRTVTVPVTSGVSAVIEPDGRIVSRTGMFTPASLVEKVPLRSSQTPATRLGIWPEIALLLVAAGGLGWAATGALRTRRATGAAEDAEREPRTATGDAEDAPASAGGGQ
ncbi:apolipoprotein N-acyltransferase [Streptomyces odontomachi]|uniref:apolipoprotein N-acyltransferase n=1 Tax=Streptomyces odontomachi TaxID=2944940 RepID=UPI00210E22E1|nr:apolipoprotein N-acyltransferase [Streptomyces sp. ODS25]